MDGPLMGFYQKKPVIVQATQLSPATAKDLAEWCGGQLVEELDAEDPSKKFVAINIPTLEGVMRASEGDFVIKGVKGEFYPCKADIFEDTYQKVEI
jgi:hypothetical protein